MLSFLSSSVNQKCVCVGGGFHCLLDREGSKSMRVRPLERGKTCYMSESDKHRSGVGECGLP